MSRGGPSRARRGPTRSFLTRVVLLVITAVGVAGPAGAASAQVGAPPERTVWTPYTGVVVQAGSTVQFELNVTSPAVEPVGLAVEAPAGWQTTLRGGGFVVTRITAGPDDPGRAQLEVSVPPDAAVGEYQVTVAAQFPQQESRLVIPVQVAEEVASAVTLSVDFPSLEGGPADTFSYTLTVVNNTPEAQTFTFAARGPSGWEVSASPQAQQQANTVTIEAGATADVAVSARPAAGTAAGEYPVEVEVTAASGASALAQLTAVVTGTPELAISTPDGQLNASGQAGATTSETILVTNAGTAPLDGVTFAATPPGSWEVTFEPDSIAAIAPGETAQVLANVRPASDAIAGDYVVTVRASSGTNSDELELRYSVTRSSWVALVAVVVIAGALGLLYGVYRRFGRR